jgi:hypothetical protein
MCVILNLRPFFVRIDIDQFTWPFEVAIEMFIIAAIDKSVLTRADSTHLMMQNGKHAICVNRKQ